MSKTTFRVDSKRWGQFCGVCEEIFLRRNAYLNHVLPGEIQILEQLPPNNDEAHQWLKNTWYGKHGRLRTNVTEYVSVMLEKPLIDRLNQACNERRIPRDAIVHCVLMFLTKRLHDPALVIKDPRTTRDIDSMLIEATLNAKDEGIDGNGEEISQVLNSMRFALNDIAITMWDINLDPLRLDYYQKELSFPPEKLAKGKEADKEIEELIAEYISTNSQIRKDANKCQ